MSESETDERAPAAGDAEFDEPPAPPPEEPPRTAAGGLTAAVAWLALLFGLAAAGAAGWLAWDRFRSVGEADAGVSAVAELSRATESSLGEIESSLDGLRQQLDEIRSAGGADAERIDVLRDEVGALEDKADLLESVTPRIGNLERSVASLQGIELDARNTYLLSEAEYYMQIANAQLQLANNPHLATLALEQADDRLSQVGDPALTEVRRTLANEIAALEIMDKPDVAGATLMLGSLSRVADSLPLRQAEDPGAEAAGDETEAAGSVERAWNAVKDAAGGLVTYTRPGDTETPLLAPDSEPLIRSNLSLQLQAARLALLRGEQEAFEQSLDDADHWIERYFDTSEASVSAARETLEEIRNDYSRVTPPDISESLRLLRQYQTMADAEE